MRSLCGGACLNCMCDNSVREMVLKPLLLLMISGQAGYFTKQDKPGPVEITTACQQHRPKCKSQLLSSSTMISRTFLLQSRRLTHLLSVRLLLSACQTMTRLWRCCLVLICMRHPSAASNLPQARSPDSRCSPSWRSWAAVRRRLTTAISRCASWQAVILSYQNDSTGQGFAGGRQPQHHRQPRSTASER
jgi:hypothetical protein